MIDRREFGRLRKVLADADSRRELVIRESRDVLKDAKAAIYAMHRNDDSSVDVLMGSAKSRAVKLGKVLRRFPELLYGALSEALEEYAEAFCYVYYMRKGVLPSVKTVGVPVLPYLGGVCDCVGELVRRAMNDVISGNVKSVPKIRQLCCELYEELMLFDWRNIPIRRKFDSIKYSIEKLDDLMLQLSKR